MPLPLLPRNINDPTAQDKRERKCIADFERRVKMIGKEVKAILDRQHYKVLTLNAAAYTIKKYQFNIDEFLFDSITDEIDSLIDRIILEGGDERRLWLSTGYVEPAYQQGTAMAHSNLAVQSAAYKLSRPELANILMSPAYRTRLGYIRAREFEEMKGYSANLKKQFGTILLDGMATGLNPLDIADRIADQTGTSLFDARRIARTEITTALRRSRLDESESAMQSLGLPVMMMQISALSATTRLSHALRHAKLYTIQEMRDWMSTSPNMINCKCTFVEVMVDDEGQPWVPDIIEKARAMWPEDAEFRKG